MKGILLAGGYGTRLYPITRVLSKQLLPVYDKPMVYYPVTVLMELGVREILLLTHPEDLSGYQYILKDGSQWGISIHYKTQPTTVGIADHLILASKFIQDSSIALMLGDNVFYGNAWTALRHQAQQGLPKPTVVTHFVEDPTPYGVVEFEGERPVRLIEKSKRVVSHQAITGLYFYDPSVIDRIKALPDSLQRTLTATVLNNMYLEQQQLNICSWSSGEALWFDAGTPDSLLAAANCIQSLQFKKNILIGSPEETAWRLGYIDAFQLERMIQDPPRTRYELSLKRLLYQFA